MAGRAREGAPLPLVFARIAALNEMQYRVNFWLQLLQSCIAVATALVVLSLVFGYTDELAGWSRDELLVVMGVHVAMGGFIRAVVQPNMIRLMEDIREGKLDHTLLKPADAQLLVSSKELRLWQLVDCLVGAVLVGVALARLGGGAGVLGVLACLATLVVGAVLVYCLYLAVASSAFWVVRLDFVTDLFDSLYQAGRWPVGVYPAWLRGVFTFLVPLAFAVTVPAQAVTGRLGWVTALGAVVFAVVLATATRLLWRYALRHYAGASA